MYSSFEPNDKEPGWSGLCSDQDTDWAVLGSNRGRGNPFFYLFQNIRTGSGANLTSYSMRSMVILRE